MRHETCDGTVSVGKCPGSSNIKCCSRESLCKLTPEDCKFPNQEFNKEKCKCACKKPFTGKNCDTIICNKDANDCQGQMHLFLL